MQLHVLAGSAELLQPEFLTPEAAAGLIGPRARVAQAFWISPSCGDEYHGFLQGEPGDRRTAVMASALKDGFGTRFEPLLILADLLDEIHPARQRKLPGIAMNLRSQLTVLSEILACGHVRQLHLHGLALPSNADPDESWAVPAGIVPGAVRDRMERLRTAVTGDMGAYAVETRVTEVTPDLPVFNTLCNNSLCAQFARRLEPRLLKHGWAPDPETLARAISGIFSDWNSKGIFLTLPLRPDHLDATEDLIFERLLQNN